VKWFLRRQQKTPAIDVTGPAAEEPRKGDPHILAADHVPPNLSTLWNQPTDVWWVGNAPLRTRLTEQRDHDRWRRP
jgi:hypothetical protein